MVSIVSWLAAALAVTGNVLVIWKSRWGYVLWLMSNGYYIWYNWRLGSSAQAALFVVYTGLSVWGFIRWRTS